MDVYKDYKLKLKDGGLVKLSFSPNLDNHITKYKDNKPVEGVFLMDCGIWLLMPRIMRYCFEQDVDLRERKFLRNLRVKDSRYPIKLSEDALISDFRRPLGVSGSVATFNRRLMLRSVPAYCKGEISFDSRDVSGLIAGIIKRLDYNGVRGAQIRSIKIVQFYHKCLNEGLIS
jgi:hypothetical protein